MTGLLRILERTLGETIDIKRSLPGDLWPIAIDKGQFETALLNLALNARDAMPDGGRLGVDTSNVTLDRRMALSDGHVPPGEYVKMTVSDTGTGMTGDVIERAVQPFFTTKDAKHGSGLGLSMVYGFAKQSGGYFELSSSPGEGTSATLYLPRTHASAGRWADCFGRYGETGAQGRAHSPGRGRQPCTAHGQADSAGSGLHCSGGRGRAGGAGAAQGDTGHRPPVHRHRPAARTQRVRTRRRRQATVSRPADPLHVRLCRGPPVAWPRFDGSDPAGEKAVPERGSRPRGRACIGSR